MLLPWPHARANRVNPADVGGDCDCGGASAVKRIGDRVVQQVHDRSDSRIGVV